jgi:hypothetical protein
MGTGEGDLKYGKIKNKTRDKREDIYRRRDNNNGHK